MLIKTSDYCKTQDDLDFILRKIKDISSEFGLKLKSDMKLELIPEFSYLCVLNNEIIGILQADIIGMAIFEVEVFKFRDSNTFSRDLLKFYKMLASLNMHRLRFSVAQNNEYAEELALKFIKKYFSYAKLKYFMQSEFYNTFVYENTRIGDNIWN